MLPARIGFIFRKAESNFPWIAQGCTVNFSRDSATYMPHDQLQGTADRRIGTIALPERIDAPVHSDFFRNGAVDDDDRS